MTDLNNLADLIKSLEPFEDKRAGSLRVGVDEVRQILSALRSAGKMREALDAIRLRFDPPYSADIAAEMIRIASAALKTEGE